MVPIKWLFEHLLALIESQGLRKASGPAQNLPVLNFFRRVREDCGEKDFCALTFLVLFCLTKKVQKEVAFTTPINLQINKLFLHYLLPQSHFLVMS